MRPSTLSSLAAALALAGASSAFADDPALSFSTTDSTFGVNGNGGDSTNQPGTDYYQSGDYSTGVYVGETKVGSNTINSNYVDSAPNAYARAYASGTFSGTARAFVAWEIQGTLGNIPTVATGIPVLLSGDAYVGYDSATVTDPNSLAPGAFASAYALIQMSGADPQVFYCGGRLLNYGVQSCGDNDVSTDFRLIPSTTTPGLYEGYVTISATSSVSNALDPISYGSPTNDDTKDATTFIDPTVTIDADFYKLYPNAKLTFNPFVGNGASINGAPIPPPSSAAPEPAAWALMMAGLGFVGASLRRRRPVVGSQQA